MTAALAMVGFVLGSGRAGRALGWFALAATAGCALVWARSDWVAQPRLERPVVTDVAARVESVDYLAAKQAVRLMLGLRTLGFRRGCGSRSTTTSSRRASRPAP